MSQEKKTYEDREEKDVPYWWWTEHLSESSGKYLLTSPLTSWPPSLSSWQLPPAGPHQRLHWGPVSGSAGLAPDGLGGGHGRPPSHRPPAWHLDRTGETTLRSGPRGWYHYTQFSVLIAICSCQIFKKDFIKIKTMLPGKTMKELVLYYYRYLICNLPVFLWFLCPAFIFHRKSGNMWREFKFEKENFLFEFVISKLN